MPCLVSIGAEHRIGAHDILAVSPYYMQVELFERVMPRSVRVGTVDKFHGQEPVAVLISMATSIGVDFTEGSNVCKLATVSMSLLRVPDLWL